MGKTLNTDLYGKYEGCRSIITEVGVADDSTTEQGRIEGNNQIGQSAETANFDISQL